MDRNLVRPHDGFGPFAARTAVGVCWFVAGCVTFALFFTTSKTLPRSTILRHDPSWDSRSEVKSYGIRPGIDAVQIPQQPEDPKAPVTPCRIVFKNRASGKELAAIENFLGGRMTWFWIDSIHNLLAIGSATYGRVDLYSWPACAPLGIRYEAGPCYNLACSRDGKRVLTSSDQGFKEWDTCTGAELGAWKQYRARLKDESLSSPRFYYDQSNQPKLIRIADRTIERWDLHSGQVDFRLTPTCEIYDGARETWLFSLDFDHDLLACVLNDNEIGLWSLKQRKLLRSFHRPRDLDDLELSPDARFLTYRCDREMNRFLQNFLYKVSPNLEQLFIKPTNMGMIALSGPLVDTNWAFPGGTYCEFADDCVRVYTSREEIGYEFDLPPRWQLFTPWAWAALGAWLGLSVLWWRLRKRRPGPAPVLRFDP